MSDLRVRISVGEKAIKQGHMDLICDVTHHDMISGKIERITGDHKLAEDIADWCGMATPGEIYDFDYGKAEIEDRKTA